MPPCELLLPWVVQACSPPSFPSPSSSRLQGRRIAYQLLCEMTITHWHTPPSLSHLTHFYRLLHLALRSKSVRQQELLQQSNRYCTLYPYPLHSPLLSLPPSSRSRRSPLIPLLTLSHSFLLALLFPLSFLLPSPPPPAPSPPPPPVPSSPSCPLLLPPLLPLLSPPPAPLSSPSYPLLLPPSPPPPTLPSGHVCCSHQVWLLPLFLWPGWLLCATSRLHRSL